MNKSEKLGRKIKGVLLNTHAKNEEGGADGRRLDGGDGHEGRDDRVDSEAELQRAHDRPDRAWRSCWHCAPGC